MNSITPAITTPDADLTGRAAAYEPTDSRVRDLQALLDLSQELAAKDSLEDVLATLVAAIVTATKCTTGSLFLFDAERHELYSRVVDGSITREIRFRAEKGIAGAVFQSGMPEIINDPYNDPRFLRDIDQQTGFKTESILCAPVYSAKGRVMGVAQVLNKIGGGFEKPDLDRLLTMTRQASVVLRGIQDIERIKKLRDEEMAFLDLVATLTSELDLNTVLQHIMGEATKMLNAERSTLFLHDQKTNELFARIAQGNGVGEIRLPSHLGIAGAVFTSNQSINIPHAYADLRFNPAFDKKTGFFTRSILCVPVANKEGQVIGVTQVLNHRGGPFTEADESRLKAFTAQVAIALENAKLFEDVQKMKNYNDSMLQSMSNGVLTMDVEGKIVTCNASGLKILRTSLPAMIGKLASETFTHDNGWLKEQIDRVMTSELPETVMDAALLVPKDDGTLESISVNLSVLPLHGGDGQIGTKTSTKAKETKAKADDKPAVKERLGVMVMIEDISSEKRVKATMARYMDSGLAAKLLEGGGDDYLNGRASEVTILFSDIRSFTTITEALGAQGTVALLNEYFTLMVDCLSREGGVLDKFIGDAVMAGFGVLVPHEDDPDRGVRTCIAMIRTLDEWNAVRASKNLPPVKIGIGLNTDVVITGNIGSPKRVDYTMIGDGVNLAARLESACKMYGAKILISENTRKKLKGIYRMREADLVVVKGKTEPVVVWEVLDFHTEETFPSMMTVLGHFQEGIGHWRAGAFGPALTAFKAAHAKHPTDVMSAMYIERCDHMIAHPPEGRWDGVWTMDSK